MVIDDPFEEITAMRLTTRLKSPMLWKFDDSFHLNLMEIDEDAPTALVIDEPRMMVPMDLVSLSCGIRHLKSSGVITRRIGPFETQRIGPFESFKWIRLRQTTR